MRTTLDLTPEAWRVAKAVARERHESLGKVVSDFILRQPTAPAVPQARSAAGFPVFSSGKPVTSEDVQRLLDEDLREPHHQPDAA